MSKTVEYQTIQFTDFVYTHLNAKTVLFQIIHFTKSISFSSIQPIDRTLFGASAPSQRKPGNDGNEGVLRIP